MLVSILISFSSHLCASKIESATATDKSHSATFSTVDAIESILFIPLSKISMLEGNAF